MNKPNPYIWTRLVLIFALICGFGLPASAAMTYMPPPALAPACTAGGPTPCVDYFGVANFANSPLPSCTITGFTVSSPGAGYSAPAVSVTDPNPACAATASATLVGGTITAVTLSGGGASCMAPQVIITDATGTGALAAATTGAPCTGGLKKFLDTLPPLCAVGTNNLTQCIPIATPNTTTFPGSDYYSIGVKDTSRQMHTNLPQTKIRGYAELDANGNPVGTQQYLGPMIVAVKDRPVRFKFTNMLATGNAGDLFLPTDVTYMGAGMGPDGSFYSQNRAVIHLHGGNSPWISDGTPHQWITPANEMDVSYPKGDGFQNVPDMVGPGSPIGMTNPNPLDGQGTYYFTNQQSGRLMFFHDHSYGMTRLNVYAGEAAPFLIVDPVEETALKNATVPGTIPNITPAGNADLATADAAHLIPLVIQDKTFVPDPATQLAFEDPTWSTTLYGGFGSLWFPHIYTPNQNPADLMGMNAYGRWDYGPWFWPPQTSLTAGPLSIPCTSSAFPGQTVQCPITPNPSGVMEGFMDTPVVNGTAYPVLHVAPEAYRFRILSVGNDRTLNLQLYYAATAPAPGATAGTVCIGAAAPAANCTEVNMLPAATPVGGLPIPACTTATQISNPAVGVGLALGATDPLTGNPLNGTGLPANCWPSTWPTDGREGGVPDPRTAGPAMIQIGSEGGLLPAPVVIPSTPVGYEYMRRSITVLNVSTHGLLVGPAERADVIIDFSSVPAGSTLLLYNDGPAPIPGFDARLDYYTGDLDQTASGGAPTTQPGYGPNTRTIMQIVVDQPASGATPFSLPAVQNAFKTTALQQGLFAKDQPTPVIPQSVYNSAYNSTFTDTFSRIQDTSLTYTPIGSTTPVTTTMVRKTIQELFELTYGRMNATLGTELPLTNFLTQTTIPLGYIDPPTEIIQDGQNQIWKITHNGVDTHLIHFHLFNVQVINRVGWDGTVRPPDPNEAGWKETVRMNPLEDAIVAVKPITPVLPFPIPNSIRRFDTTMNVGTTGQFTNVDPYTNNPMTVNNDVINFGWEYVWHCHILGHEEMDMMRPIIYQVAPEAPSNLVVAVSGSTAMLRWKDNSASASQAGGGFVLQRATDANFSQNLVAYTIGPSTGVGSSVTYNDTLGADPTYYYRVQAVVNNAYNGYTTGGPLTTTLASAWSGTVVVGATRVTPLALSFGNQLIMTTSAGQTVTLSNIGNTSLTISSIGITGTNAGDFARTTTCGGTLAAGANCTISVTFRPTATGARSASLSISSSDPVNPTLTVALSGTGTMPIAGVSPASLTFASQLINTTSAGQTVTLSNTGTAALTISSIGITGANASNFARTTTCRATLAAGASCTISVTFKPTATGTRTASLDISSSDPVNPGLSVALSGTGSASLAPIAGVSPTSLTFASQTVNTTSAAQVVTLSNTGNASLTITAIGISGTNSSNFARTTTCGMSLAAGANCTISVTFKPTATGTRTASLNISSSDPVNPGLSVALSGTGSASLAPTAGVSPTSLTFASQTVNTTSAGQTVTLSNTGTASLTISSIGITGTNSGDFARTTTCGGSLAAGANCTISVTFTPTATGTRLASVSISSSDPVNPTLTVALSGTGAAVATPVAGVAPGSLTFLSQLVNTTSAGQTVTLSNTGTASLTISGIGIAGTNSGDFARTTTCGGSLAAGASCTISVTFKPTATGTRTASLNISSSDPVHPGLSVALSGTGSATLAPIAGVSPTSLTFASQTVNTTSAAQVVTLSNTGNASLTITAIGISGTNSSNFARTTTCGMSLAAGANCTISVTFKPTATGTRTASLNISSSDPVHPGLSVALSGTGQ